MDLERETLGRVDRKLLARLGQNEVYQMVRVPVTSATWKRCCETVGVSMGRAIVALIERELGVVDDDDDDQQPVSTGDMQEQLDVREAELDAREAELAAEFNRLVAEAQRLSTWQAELRSFEYNLEAPTPTT